jgi:hypothetical protein
MTLNLQSLAAVGKPSCINDQRFSAVAEYPQQKKKVGENLHHCDVEAIEMIYVNVFTIYDMA